MFDIEYFRRDPRPFFKFAKEIYPGQFQPSPCHKFIAMLDKQGKLLRNYTQNIDTLEQVAGVQRIIQCHGSFATASCLICKQKAGCDAIKEDVFNQVVPRCPKCTDIPLAIMKPDIVFFGENLPEQFHRAMKQDKDDVDLLIVIGSSLKVRPVALIPSSIPHEVPQVLINREQLPHLNFDVELLGDCDVIVNELCHRLGGDFQQLCYNSSRLSEITEKPARPAPAHAGEEQAGEATRGSADERGPRTAEPAAAAREEAPALQDGLRRRCWLNRRCRSPISKRLDSSQYLFQAPNHYIFHGAEVYSNSEDETSSSCDSEDSCSSAEGLEEEGGNEWLRPPAEEDEDDSPRDTLPENQASEGPAAPSSLTNCTEAANHTDATDL
uniref:Deacetylase sirtuin-type domain-containing protein n=2 Tax=Denticeps clupeoides TaxID=299321 RepID=A0AAY4C4Z8_9TELE